MRKSLQVGRMGTLGLVLVAALALAGLAASGAAAAPEWKGCVKTEPKNTGKYTDKLCTLESPGGEGAYELVPSVGKGKGFKGKGGAVTMPLRFPENPQYEIKCTSVKASGKPALPNRLEEVILEFKGCKWTFGEHPSTAYCQSGTKKGVIVTNGLGGEMVDIEGGSGVGSLLEAEAGPTAPLATFTCREIATVNLFGSFIAEHTGNVGVVAKEAQDHFVVGPGIGAVEEKGRHGPIFVTPLVNIPTHKTGGSTTEHFLEFEVTEVGFAEPFGTFPEGLEGTVGEKGEALMIVP